ncbi:hypothetical protein PIB30_095603 [Stylosanthes scabra]|uniref:Uncharacterized protein n=1 Tax=Stylosanthes scabra TaxID=79078 RepID=A0ABU6QV94_9FABA|nr:hypothetical protein [Stylosanthes scabra]
MEIRNPKKGTAKGNEADETMHEVVKFASEAVAGSSDGTRMFDSFDTPKQQPPPVEAPAMQDVVEEEHQDEPTTVVMPEGVDPLHEDPEPCSLTLQPWLQPEAEGCAAKGLMDSPDAMITDVLLSINQGGPGPSTQPTNDDNQDLGDQCRTPDPLQQHDTNAPAKHELEARCAAWAMLDNDNKYETIFQLRGRGPSRL